MLLERFPPQYLRILPRAAWRPHPAIDERAVWEALPAELRRGYVSHAASLLERPWPELPASLYLQYSRDGNRSRFQKPYYERRLTLGSLLLAECMEDRGRFVERLADGAWLLCEESSWCLPAHIRVQRAGCGLPDTAEQVLDLFAAETAAELAWVSYLVQSPLERFSPLLVPRLHREIRLRVVDPFLAREDYQWMGLSGQGDRPNNWNPWISSNVLAAALLTEDDEGRRRAVVTKAMRCLDRFLEPYPRDGGCDEGPTYWGRAAGSVYDCLETLSGVTEGQLDLWSDPLITEMGRYIVRAHIASGYFVSFADASAVAALPAGVVYGYGRRIGDSGLVGLGASLLCVEHGPELDGHGSPERRLRELFLNRAHLDSRPSLPLYRDSWLPETQLMCAREVAGSTRGFYVAAKGGHNAESHNHNDIGSFIVFLHGEPLIVDAGVGEYSRATFDPRERYTIWTMQSAYHSLLPAVDGIMQSPGRSFAARDLRYATDDASSSLEMEIGGAYPPEAGIRSWRRKVTLHRGQAVEVRDAFELERLPREISLGLLTPCLVTVEGGGKVRLHAVELPEGRRSGAALIRLEVPGSGEPELAAETIELSDPRLAAVWGDRLNRIEVILRPSALTGSLRLMVSEG